MKKNYKAPEYELIPLETADVITTSPDGFEPDEDGNIDLPTIPW